MTLSPLISVIVPVYNTEKYLHRCIDSILSQSHKNFELLLIDDGSSDESGNICDKYAKKDLRVHVFHKENGGVSSARNVGLNNAKGEWIIFVDADDSLDMHLLNTIISYSSSTIQLIHYGWNIYDGENITSHNISKNEEYISLEKACKKNIFHGYVWLYAFRTSIIHNNKLRFREDIDYAEDWDFIIKYYSYTNQMFLLKECYYNYVIRFGSATNKSLGSKYIKDNFEMYLSVMKCCQGKPHWFKQFVSKRIYDINIWLVNNVLFRDITLIRDYKKSYNYLSQQEVVLCLSPILWAPKYVSPWCYSIICRIYNRLKRYNLI